MSKDLNYPEFIGAQITKEQQDKVKKSGLSNSEFIRQAIDFYDEVRLSTNIEYKIRVIGECIDTLKVYQQNLKNQYFKTFKDTAENLKNTGGSGANLKGLNPEVYKEPAQTFKDTAENLKSDLNLKGQTFKDTAENLKGEKYEKQTNDFKNIEDTIARLIANKGHLTDADYSYQAGRIGKTSKELKQYIRENHDKLEKKASKYR